MLSNIINQGDDNMNIGAHLSISKGYVSAVKQAIDIGANTFQFFTRNPRGGKARKLDLEDMRKADELCKENNFVSLLAHAPYTYNLASYKEETWGFAKDRLREDIDKLNHLESCNYIVIHPGNHLNKGLEYGIERISQGLNDILSREEKTMILLETMSGKGTEVGFAFEQLRDIIDKVKYSDNIGVCFDTCHTFSAGYNILDDLDNILESFDKIIGLDKLKMIHLNDSQHSLDSKKDRHARIGEGTLGLDGILKFINHKKIKDIPMILETPNEIEGYEHEIKILKYGLKA